MLGHAGTASPRAESETLLMTVLALRRAELFARRAPLSPKEAEAFALLLERRSAGAPVQHLTGGQRFLGLDLEVLPGVFVPRPETEGLVVAALEAIAERRSPVVVDVGTGTGAIALSIGSARRDARVVATDLSAAAVRLARRNADRLRVPVEVVGGDLLDPVPPELHGRLDLIVSNPPYLEPGDRDSLPEDVRADPGAALFGGTDMHRRLVAAAGEWLSPGGWLAVEIGADQGEAVRGLFESTLERVRLHPDLAGRARVVLGRRPSG
jgi:release factor glutamine methyltransferase